MYSCEFPVDFGPFTADCMADPREAVSVRLALSDRWQVWPACPEHIDRMTAELRSIGFVVTARYPCDDGAARRVAEAAPEVAA